MIVKTNLKAFVQHYYNFNSGTFLFHMKDVNREFLLRMSYMEIYNEEINDLLVPEHLKLQIHESLEVMWFLCSLYVVPVLFPDSWVLSYTAGNICCWLKRGNCNLSRTSSELYGFWRM